jgi:outer membrane protein TolC
MSDRARLAMLALALASAPLIAQTAPPSPGPLTLASALERARARSPETAIARSEAEEARANARIAGAAFRPEAYLTTTPGYSSGLPVMVAGQVPSIFGLSVRATLYDPSTSAVELSTAAESDARQAELARSEAAVERAVTAAYARVASDRRRTEAARRALAGREAIFRRASALKAEGRATELEVSRAELDVLKAKQRLLDRNLGSDLDTLELERLVDWPAGTPLELSDDPLVAVAPPPPSNNLDAVRTADPEVRALDKQIEDLGRAAQIRSRWFQPSVVAEAQYLRLAKYNNYDQYFVKFEENDFVVAVAVSVPLWTGGRHGDAGLAAKARLERTQARRRARERDLELVVRRAETELARTSASATVARSAEAWAAESLRVAKALAVEGRGNLSDVDLAEIAAADAAEDAANAADAELAARLTLRELRGEPPVR